MGDGGKLFVQRRYLSEEEVRLWGTRSLGPNGPGEYSPRQHPGAKCQASSKP